VSDTLTPAERKQRPLASGVLDYFADALMEVAYCSFIGNEQHNPGQPLHWAKEKSTDHADALLRHLKDRGTLDSDNVRHSAKAAWRALANLQMEIEAERKKAQVEPAQANALDSPGDYIQQLREAAQRTPQEPQDKLQAWYEEQVDRLKPGESLVLTGKDYQKGAKRDAKPAVTRVKASDPYPDRMTDAYAPRGSYPLGYKDDGF
jgi:hypothetical protein